MFDALYSFKRFRYIHPFISQNNVFRVRNGELIRKTACFFSEKLDVYIDTSDGVNDDLKINEYCGRIISAAKHSRGKRFLFFKCAHSSVWSKNIEQLAAENNGVVIPFFKWSFNDKFYSYTLPNLSNLRSEVALSKHGYDVGLFADFNKEYLYPRPSDLNGKISWMDHDNFNIDGSSKDTGWYEIKSRPDILNSLKNSAYKAITGSFSFPDYIHSSMKCKAVLNPPGIGEYTSRIMDQTALGNLVVLRKNSYDQGYSWKEYIPEVNFSSPDWKQELQKIIDNRVYWAEKGRYYYDKLWSPESVFDFMMKEIARELG